VLRCMSPVDPERSFAHRDISSAPSGKCRHHDYRVAPPSPTRMNGAQIILVRPKKGSAHAGCSFRPSPRASASDRCSPPGAMDAHGTLSQSLSETEKIERLEAYQLHAGARGERIAARVVLDLGHQSPRASTSDHPELSTITIL
jgi:hypothetical protein